MLTLSLFAVSYQIAFSKVISAPSTFIATNWWQLVQLSSQLQKKDIGRGKVRALTLALQRNRVATINGIYIIQFWFILNTPLSRPWQIDIFAPKTPEIVVKTLSIYMYMVRIRYFQKSWKIILIYAKMILIDFLLMLFFKLRQGASIGTNCWMVGRSVGWWKKMYVSNKDDYRSLLCICACSIHCGMHTKQEIELLPCATTCIPTSCYPYQSLTDLPMRNMFF